LNDPKAGLFLALVEAAINAGGGRSHLRRARSVSRQLPRDVSAEAMANMFLRWLYKQPFEAFDGILLQILERKSGGAQFVQPGMDHVSTKIENNMKTYHLSHRNDRWELSVKGGATIATYDTKKEGMKEARRLMKNDPGSLKIHRADGTFESNALITTLSIRQSPQDD
jgi:hypothetical protein